MNRAHRVHVIVAVLTSAVFGVGLAPTSSALAATESRSDAGVALSLDGTTWAPDLASPLFDQDTRWVPGDRRHASFFVRNDGGSDAELVIAVDTEDRDGLITGDAVTLTATTPARSRAVPVASTPTTLGSLAQGASERIDVSALFHGAATNATMRQMVRFAVVVDLSGTPSNGATGNGATTSAAGSPIPTGLLAYTGSDRPWGVLVIGLATLTIGLTALIALIALRRRAHPRRRSTHRRGARS